MRVIGITASRSLEECEGAEDWVIQAICDHVRRFKLEVLVVGDARLGGDRWALIAAAAMQIPAFVYEAQTGGITRFSGGEPKDVGSWIKPAELAALEEAKRPLARNAKMARDIAKKDPDGLMLGFMRITPETIHGGGTGHTLKHAVEARLTTRVLLWGFSPAVDGGELPEQFRKNATKRATAA